MKNKHKTLLVILMSLVILAIAIIAIFLFRGKNHTLTLDQFKQGEEYQFDNIAWNMSYEEVSRLLPYALETDAGRVPAPEGMAFYKSKSSYDLYGQNAVASFEFYSDELKILTFDFHLDENYEEWFEKLATELTQLYGPESDKKENASEDALGQINIIVYTWETDHTKLQIDLITGSDIDPLGRIGLAIK